MTKDRRAGRVAPPSWTIAQGNDGLTSAHGADVTATLAID